MHTKSSWRVLFGPLLAAVAAGVFLTESAQAQQTGLFPLHPIKRKRVPCSQEDPVYRIYKDQYFGYHPTLWRQFPSGWGAPSPEAPDAKASFREIPLQPPDWGGYDDEDEDQDAPGGEGPARRPDTRPNLPAPPTEDERSPFDMDDRLAPTPRLDTPPRQQPAPREQPPSLDDDDRSPFDLPTPRAGSGSRPAAPDLSSPTAPVGARYRQDEDFGPEDLGGPLLATPDMDFDDGMHLGGPADHNHRHGSHDQSTTPQPSRRSRLAAMMDGLGWNAWRR